MQSDRYMRIVLTVIAVCLVWVCLRDVAVVHPAYASDTMDVRIVDSTTSLDVVINAGVPVNVRVVQ